MIFCKFFDTRIAKYATKSCFGWQYGHAFFMFEVILFHSLGYRCQTSLMPIIFYYIKKVTRQQFYGMPTGSVIV